MKKVIGVVIILFFVCFLGIQLIPAERSNPEVVADIEAPIEVKEILKRSCYDCHSNETVWPWYSYVAPVSWLVSHDVEEGREELNFSEWNRHSKDSEMMEEIVEEVAEGEMPLSIYLITHPKASVSEQELEILKKWAGFHGAGAGHHEDD